MPDLLPPNASELERRLDGVISTRLEIDPAIRLVWSPSAAPMDLLPYQAHAYSVDLWDEVWSEETKRNVTAESLKVHRRKGTNGAIQDAIRAAGYGECEVLDGLDARYRDGRRSRNATFFHSTYAHWAWFTVILERPVTIQQAEQIKRIINLAKREACNLHQVRYDRALNLHNNTILRNGDYTHGVIDGQSI